MSVSGAFGDTQPGWRSTASYNSSRRAFPLFGRSKSGRKVAARGHRIGPVFGEFLLDEKVFNESLFRVLFVYPIFWADWTAFCSLDRHLLAREFHCSSMVENPCIVNNRKESGWLTISSTICRSESRPMLDGRKGVQEAPKIRARGVHKLLPI